MDTNTKTVEGYFGPKQITRDDFIKRWAGLVGDAYSLANTSADIAELDKNEGTRREAGGCAVGPHQMSRESSLWVLCTNAAWFITTLVLYVWHAPRIGC